MVMTKREATRNKQKRIIAYVMYVILQQLCFFFRVRGNCCSSWRNSTGVVIVRCCFSAVFVCARQGIVRYTAVAERGTGDGLIVK